MIVLTYMGYELETDGSNYKGKFGSDVIRFDTVGMWKQYVDMLCHGH